MDSIYLQPYSYVTLDASNNQFVWPAVLRPTGPTIGEKRATLYQAPKATTTWASGDKEQAIIPFTLSGEVTFDDEYDANNFITLALAHLKVAVKLKRLNKEGLLIPGASSLVPTYGERANIVTINLTIHPKELPKQNGLVCVW